MSCANGVCTPTAKDAVLNASMLANMLGQGAVTVNTGSGSLASEVKDITVASGFFWASANALTLDANRSIILNAFVYDSGTAAVALITNDGGSGGALTFGQKGRLSFLGTSNALTINGNAFTLEKSIATLANAMKANPSGNYALANAYNAKPDGAYKSAPLGTFSGAFEGLGNTITNLKIADSTINDKVGLFAQIEANASARDLKLDATITADDSSYVGALAGENDGAIANVFLRGSVSDGKFAFIGGAVGLETGAITNTHANVAVTGGNSSVAGGHAGAVFSGLISLSSATGAVNGTDGVMAGGLVGANSGSIDECFATGAEMGQSEGEKLGGLVGLDQGAISDSYASGNSAAQVLSYAGGLVGFYQPGDGDGIARAYSSGSPSGPQSTFVGGLIGIDQSNGGTLSDDDWDMTTSGITNASQGAGFPANDPGIAGLTNAQLQLGLPQGFNPSVWAENQGINNGLPYLIANPPDK